MIRGTTASFIYHSPYPKSEITDVRFWFWQEGNEGTRDVSLPIEKELGDCISEPSSCELCVTLNQAETLAFRSDIIAFTQMKGVTREGVAFASKIRRVYVDEIFKDIILPSS